MDRMWRVALCGLGLVCGAMYGGTPVARAESCQADTDCDHGFSCQVTAVSGCAAPAPCQRGSDCPQPPPCETQEYRECVPASCSVDSDCADGMVCYTEHDSVCSAPSVTPVACAPNTKCEAPVDSTPPTCTDQTRQQCVPRYQLPCTTASDCGDGFRCEDNVICSCSAGAARPPVPDNAATPAAVDAGTPTSTQAEAPVPSVDGGVPEQPSKPECECQPSGTKSCVAQDIDCEQDSDCPVPFTCSVVGTSGSAGCAPAEGGGDPKGCESAPPPVQVTKRCLPPYYSGGSAVPPRSSAGDIGSGAPSGEMTTAGGSDAATPPSQPTTPVSQGATGGTTGSANDNGSASSPEIPRHARACSVLVVGDRAAGAAALWLAMGGIVAGLALRRRRR